MSFEFKRDETIEHAVRRISRAQIDEIIADLARNRRISRDRAIHESRKRLKRLRAMLRLLRDAVNRSARRRENEFLRNAGRVLSAARDAAVLVEAFDELLKNSGERVQAMAIGRVRAKLLAHRRAAAREQKEKGIGALLRSLRQCKQRVMSVKIKGKDFAALRGGLRHAFRRGRAAFDIALYDRDPAKLHEWRKIVKQLWHQIELLEPIWPEVLRQLGDKLHALADCLGEDHDLAVLREVLIDEREAFDNQDDLETLTALIAARRGELQQAAMQLGTRIYDEKPATFIERMENYWNAWRAGEGAESEAAVST